MNSREVEKSVGGLVEDGLVTREQVEEALTLRGTGDKRELPELLVALGHVWEAEYARALAERLRLDFVDLAETEVDAGAAALVERDVLRRYGALPVRIEGGTLLVAMRVATPVSQGAPTSYRAR